uniref:Ethylene-induced esterase n=1 Tax=Citrus sinensis TaxID=2711 RepID=Q94G63_CITSI|nr:ethylene-induced esterase [Citrus sinensis]AAK58599.1 ethylene-induced esterase [Citrus sinensis]
MEEVVGMEEKHFVLVHGVNHGAWCWYKLKARLVAGGHRVTAVDLAASGINMKRIEDVHTFHAYSEPLMEVLASLPAEEKVILVGHSLGGVTLALAGDKFPHKISVAVFVTAFMPDTTHRPSFVLEQYSEKMGKEDDSWLDTQFSQCDASNPSHISMLFGREFLTIKIYQLCPPEDLELAKMLVRPGSMFIDNLSKESKFSDEGYGSVKRVYLVCEEDIGLPKQFQHWMIQNYPVNEVMEIKGGDHMAMLSDPQKLCDCLSQISLKYA